MEFEVKWVDKKNIKEINKLSSKTQNTDFNDYLDITIFYNEKKCSIKNNNTNKVPIYADYRFDVSMTEPISLNNGNDDNIEENGEVSFKTTSLLLDFINRHIEKSNLIFQLASSMLNVTTIAKQSAGSPSESHGIHTILEPEIPNIFQAPITFFSTKKGSEVLISKFTISGSALSHHLSSLSSIHPTKNAKKHAEDTASYIQYWTTEHGSNRLIFYSKNKKNLSITALNCNPLKCNNPPFFIDISTASGSSLASLFTGAGTIEMALEYIPSAQDNGDINQSTTHYLKLFDGKISCSVGVNLIKDSRSIISTFTDEIKRNQQIEHPFDINRWHAFLKKNHLTKNKNNALKFDFSLEPNDQVTVYWLLNTKNTTETLTQSSICAPMPFKTRERFMLTQAIFDNTVATLSKKNATLTKKHSLNKFSVKISSSESNQNAILLSLDLESELKESFSFLNVFIKP